MNEDITIKQLQNILVEFEKEGWKAPSGEQEKLRHVLLHIGKLVGKLSTICEKREHGFEADISVIETDIVPDLLYYCLSIADIYKIDVSKAFLKRLDQNKEKVADWKKV